MEKVYLDNNVVSARSKKDEKPTETLAIEQLWAWNRAGHIRLGTSRHTLREMERAPEKHRSKLQEGTTGLAMASDDHRVVGAYLETDWRGGCTSNVLSSDVVNEPLFAAILATGLDNNDAKHFMYAAHNGFTRFVTMDGFVVKRQPALEALCPAVRVQLPSEFVAEVTALFGPSREYDPPALPRILGLKGPASP